MSTRLLQRAHARRGARRGGPRAGRRGRRAARRASASRRSTPARSERAQRDRAPSSPSGSASRSRPRRRSTRSTSATGPAAASRTSPDDPPGRAGTRRAASPRPPGGESDAGGSGSASSRALGRSRRHPDGAVVLVSHADPIARACCYSLGLPLDAWTAIEIAPASVSRPRSSGDGAASSSAQRAIDARRRAHEDRRLRPDRLLVLGQRPRHAVARAHAARWRRAATRSSSSSATCPTTRGNRDLHELPGGELVLYRGLGRGRGRGRGASWRDADVAIVTSYCPDGVAATELVLATRRGRCASSTISTRRSRSARLDGGRARRLHRAATASRAFDLVLSYTGGAALDGAARRGSARGASRRSTAMSIPTCTVRSPPRPAFAADLSYLGTYAADRQAALEALFIEPARQRPDAALPHRRRAVSAGLSLDAEHLLRPPPAARRSTRPSTPRRG